MKTQHTPGPWRARPSDTNPARVWITQDAPPNTKAVPFIAQCAEGNPQAEANARLIAASPELLDALAECVAWHDLDGQRSQPVYSTQSDVGRRMIAAARAAIAKATGGTQ